MREITRGFFDRNSTVCETALTDSLSCYIQKLCSPEESILTGTVEQRMDRVLHLAAAIYGLALAYNRPFGHPENRKPLRLLQKLIESTILVGWKDLPGALLWALLVGTAAERDSGEEKIITRYLANICLYVGVRHWDAVKEILTKFLAIEDLLDERMGRPSRD